MHKTEKQIQQLKALRVCDDDWQKWGEVAVSLGLTRSGFIKQATARAAELILSGGTSYFVNGGGATTQNTRIEVVGANGTGNENASDRRQRRGVSQGRSDEGRKKSPKAKGQG